MLNTKSESFLTQSARYLVGDKYACEFTKKAGASDWLQEFMLHLANASAGPADYLTVAVVGEFKAGKSTLINAMLRKEVAFVDAFEATTSVAVIKPGPDEKVVVDSSDGSRKVMSIEKFIKACRQYEMHDVNRIEMTVNHNLPFILLDTPGMGSITTAHEERAESAIMDSSDLVLWLMDPSDMLSAKESAFLKRARSINLPVWCIISKADELTDSEIDECIECTVRTTGLDEKDVLALSAHRYMESGTDPGVVELLKRLQHASKRSREVRLQAETAKVMELLDEFEKATDMVSRFVESEIDWLDNEREIFAQEAEIVKNTLIRDTKLSLAESVEVFFAENLPPLLKAGTPHDYISKTLVEKFSKERLPLVTDRIALRVHEKAVAVWNESFEDRHSNLSRQIENLARNEMQNSDSEVFLRNQLLITEERREAVKRGFNAVPAAVGAGAMTLLFDPTGITANLVTMVLGALAGQVAAKSTEREIIQTKTETGINSSGVSNIAQQMSDIIVDQSVANEIGSYIDRVVEQALNERCRQRLFGMSVNDVHSIHDNLDRISRGLKQIRLSGDPGGNIPSTATYSNSKSSEPKAGEQISFAAEARVQLVGIIKQYGTEIMQSPKQVESLLKDLCPDCPKEIFLLTQCLHSGVVGRMLSLRDTLPVESLVHNAANEFRFSRVIEADAAEWAVRSWHEALFGSSLQKEE